MYDIIVIFRTQSHEDRKRGECIPKHYYSQKFLLERLQDYWGDQLKNPLLLARPSPQRDVDGRYLAIPTEQYLDIKTWARPMISGSRSHKNWGSRRSASHFTTPF